MARLWVRKKLLHSTKRDSGCARRTSPRRDAICPAASAFPNRYPNERKDKHIDKILLKKEKREERKERTYRNERSERKYRKARKEKREKSKEGEE